jgi:BASS family bile acid:Na+ symporter
MTLASILVKVSLLVFLVSSMLSVGMCLTPRTLLAPLRDTRFLLTALAANFVVAPAFAYLLTLLIPLQEPHAVGLLILACAAGAPFLPKLAESAGVEAASSVALMTLLTVVTLVFMPLALPRLAAGLAASPWDIARPLLIFIMLPLAIGLAVRSRSTNLVQRTRPTLIAFTNISIVVLLITVVVRDLPALLGVIGSGAIAAAILFIAGLFAAGYALGRKLKGEKGLLGLGTAARNVGAAVIPASQPSCDPQVMTMLVVCTVVMLVLLLAAASWLRHRTLEPSRPHAIA